jgi:large subunit ribosomal protein L5
MTLLEEYKETIVPELKTKHGYKNDLEVPVLKKIVISSGVGTARDNDFFEEVLRTLADITGQRPRVTKAKKAVAGFKLREDVRNGAYVTLRGKRMYDFMFRLTRIALPRVRDFRGVSPKSFDKTGNYSMGISDQSIFTEVNLDKLKNTFGMNITFVTSAKTNDESFDLLKKMGFPFAEK